MRTTNLGVILLPNGTFRNVRGAFFVVTVGCGEAVCSWHLVDRSQGSGIQLNTLQCRDSPLQQGIIWLTMPVA